MVTSELCLPPVVVQGALIYEVVTLDRREHGRAAGRGTRGASNTDSVQTWASVGSDGRGNVAVREDLADIMTSDGVSILEGIDEDADGEDCTWKDQLMMLAYGDPTWIPELRRYAQKEREEEVRLQGERMGRLTSWLQDISL